MKQRNVVIVGGGPAGRIIAHALHVSGKGLTVTVIKDEELNANRCAIPYGISPKKPPEKYIIPNTLVTDNGAELIIDRVEKVEPQKGRLSTSQAGDFAYDYLVLAAGSKPIIPPIPGIEAQNIVTVRSKDDMLTLRDFAQRYKKAVIVGGGHIGVEVAVVLKGLGLAVTLVESMPHILLAAMEEDMALEIEENLSKNGIEIRTNAKVTEFIAQDAKVCGVKLADGSEIPTDFAVLSIGVAPNTDLATAGINASKFGFITDDFLRTNIENIYAAGDCAEKKSFITKKPIRGELGTNAVFMARVVGANLLGKNKRFPGVINASVNETFDLSFGSAGFTEKAALAEGLEFITGYSEVPNKYPMMDGVAPIKTKLLFEKQTKRIIGGSILRQDHGAVHNVDFISLAIQMGLTLEQLQDFQYTTHPLLAARPSDNMYLFAVRDALKKL